MDSLEIAQQSANKIVKAFTRGLFADIAIHAKSKRVSKDQIFYWVERATITGYKNRKVIKDYMYKK